MKDVWEKMKFKLLNTDPDVEFLYQHCYSGCLQISQNAILIFGGQTTSAQDTSLNYIITVPEDTQNEKHLIQDIGKVKFTKPGTVMNNPQFVGKSGGSLVGACWLVREGEDVIFPQGTMVVSAFKDVNDVKYKEIFTYNLDL